MLLLILIIDLTVSVTKYNFCKYIIICADEINCSNTFGWEHPDNAKANATTTNTTTTTTTSPQKTAAA
jgi:hypothetical protein